ARVASGCSRHATRTDPGSELRTDQTPAADSDAIADRPARGARSRGGRRLAPARDPQRDRGLGRPHHGLMSATRSGAIAEALLVTVLWSSSWVLIRRGFEHGLPPLSFAGVRYS